MAAFDWPAAGVPPPPPPLPPARSFADSLRDAGASTWSAVFAPPPPLAFHGVAGVSGEDADGDSGASVDVVAVVCALAGGIAMLGFAMASMSAALRAAFGASLRDAIRVACTNRMTGLLTGAVATAVLSSSTATSLLTLQFVQSGDMTFAQSLGVSLGINIGSTLNAHLVAFQLNRYSLLLVAVGYAITVGASFHCVLPRWLSCCCGCGCCGRGAAARDPRYVGTRHVGDAIFSLGMLLLSITVIGDAIAPLRHYKPFLAMLAHMQSPLLAMLTAGASAIVFQSSNTVIAVAILLGQRGFLQLDAAVYLVLGANVGAWCGGCAR